MIPVVRAVAIYLFLLILLRLMGKRSLAEVTVFDFVVLLILSECTQQAMSGNDFSTTNAAILVATLVVLQRLADKVSDRSPRLNRVLNDVPTVVVQDGRPLDGPMRHHDLTVAEVLEEARKSQGLERLDQIRYAIVERDGGISVIQA